MGVEKFAHLTGRPPLHKRLEDQGPAGLHFQMGLFVDPSLGIALKPRRQGQRQVAPRRLVEEPGGHAGADRMQRPFRQRPLQPEEQPTVGRGGIIQTIDVRNQAALIATEIQQGVPVRAVAREPRDIIRENDPDLASGDLPH
jgi:hypothetical protein